MEGCSLPRTDSNSGSCNLLRIYLKTFLMIGKVDGNIFLQGLNFFN